MDEQSKYDSQETESASDVESCSCHGQPHTGLEVCGQQYHGVHSSHIRTRTHKPTRRSTVRGCHIEKSLKRGCCAVAAAARDEKRENYVW